MLHYARMALSFAKPPPVITIDPPTQSSSGSTSSFTFPSTSIFVSGGAPSSYTWSVTGDGGGTWTINSGQGTSAAVARVTGVVFGVPTFATISCTVVVDGISYTRSASLDYTRG